jgi:hypothetical protein
MPDVATTQFTQSRMLPVKSLCSLQVARLRDVKDSAKDSIREMGSARAARLRSAYHSLRQRGRQAVGARTPEAEVLGRDGPMRVCLRPCAC